MTAPARSNWMLYGAYGSTGRLILDEALSRGHSPVLAGRDGARLRALGQTTGLSTLELSFDDAATLRMSLSSLNCVLHAAGPFHLTGPPMREACLDAGCSYLDVNGEIDDFSAAMACDARARDAGVAVIAGVGYGVVFAECVAAQVARRMPDATWLRLSLATRTDGSSRGAQRSAAATIVAGGRDIHNGVLRRRPLASSTWRVRGTAASATRFAAAPLAELVAAHRSTGIPSIVAGIPLSRGSAALLRFAGPLLGRFLTGRAERASRAPKPVPPAAAVGLLRSRVWAEAGNARGERVAGMLETGEGYRAAAAAAVRAVELHLAKPRVGALTPVEAFGSNFALLVPGTRVQDL